jgi:threonine dehydrogenase-like Zn-dependent dehydrogenase
MAMKMLVLKGRGEVGLSDQPDPVPGFDEVVVKTAVTALCGSELHGYRGDEARAGNGGHEAAGRIAAVGEGVTELRPGQRVGVSAIAGCGRCGYCVRGQYTWCPNFRFYGNMHAERFVAAARACHVLPEDIPWDAGVLLTGDGLGVPYHTSTKIASSDIETVAVFGTGPVGLGNVLLQAHLGRRVVAVDLSSWRLEKARHLGASDTIDAADGDPAAQVRALTGGAGVDVCIEAAGRPETALACFAAVRTAGTVVFNGEQKALPLSPSDHFIRRDIAAVGAWFYHFSEFPRMLHLYRNGLRLLDLVSHRFPFHQAAAAFETFVSGQSAKVLLYWEREGEAG